MRARQHTPRASDFSAGASSPPPAPRRRRRALRALGWLLLALAALLLAAAALLWWWAGSASSLASTLARAAHYLPAGQTLESRAVSGSLRSGGRIGWLRWSSPGLSVEVHELRLGWQLAPLLHRRLELGEVQAARVQITPGDVADTEPVQAPTQLLLPLRIGASFRVQQLQWAAAPAVQATGLVGDYRFDGHEHRLRIGGVELAQGRYSASATLQALAPMAIEATLDGSLHTALPGGATMPVSAQAKLRGTLATPAAQLQLQTQLRPTAPGTAPTAESMQADLQATLAPWAPQPLESASATLRAVNLAALWPSAPATQLHGTLQAGPTPGQAAGWSMQAQLRNGLAGPWDRSRLPISALQASATYDGRSWSVPDASVQAGAGRATARGRYTPDTGALEGRVELRALRPNALHSALAAVPLSGQVSAQTQGKTVRFDVNIRAPAAPAAPTHDPAPLRIDSLTARGTWQAPAAARTGGSVQLDHLLLDALQARVEATGVQLALGAQSAQGQLALTVPGASAHARARVAPRDGSGELLLEWSDIGRTQRWLRSLPFLGADLQHALQGVGAQGPARLSTRWNGGWQTLVQQLQATSAGAARPTDQERFDLQATLSTAQLDLTLPSAAGADAARQALQLRAVQAELSGNLGQASLALSAELRSPAPRAVQAALQARISGGLVAAGQWRAQINHLRLQAQPGPPAAGQNSPPPGPPWALQLVEPLRISVHGAAPQAGASAHSAPPPAFRLETSAGQARLTGPLPGTVALRWQPLRWSGGAGAPPQLQTQGTLQGLPMAWVDALDTLGPGTPPAGSPAQPLLARMGLASDIVLDGQWNVERRAGLRASASLRRASGDLRILTVDAVEKATAGAKGSAAGVRQAEIGVEADGGALQAHLLWASERAGNIDARVSTRITLAGDGAVGASTWAADAPLAGHLRAQLPDMGLWSALAPPGWRVRGTFDADASLSGTRKAPRWSGTLGADDLAVRSLIDGVDLQGGRLRATLRGKQLDITELHLQGGRGSNARIAGFSGNRTPAPQDGGTLSGSGRITWDEAADGLSRITMSLQAEARALQVLVRADRQVSVSGHLQAQLEQGQIRLRGALGIDRATIILPDESTPHLGSDVIVRSAAREREERIQTQAREQLAAQAETAKPPDIVITLDLGNDFALQGHGITTRLTGTLEIRSSADAGAPPRVTGEVRTEEGRYRAWGQVLDVETGLIRFNGPHDNPSLDILALRPNISVRAGVQVTGTAQAPRVTLYSEPEMPDAEKLSWVVLGRSTSAGGAEAALLQQAALALLGRKGGSTAGVANRLGLDEIGFRGPAAGEDAGAAALTFGKRLSKNLYVSYERSLSGTLGTLYIFYDLSRRLTLRGQTGEKSALDIIYTVKYD
ncbi:translocation/assembly module TamB domain-containing protein [Verminephrobacter aporrectodeae]|uniref:translocation/assembly module TamB domain-containing protein n=3 Tax=Verminephrobacter aporrectodeae TaxID=1110389 RepID=UPI0022440211|nr:translocation/assembly module TamB domain-containing protein [Verminephrobacter aporrectodeae]MCW8202562.1 DUF490 domain-containing protein [Verminephrobacter aporrectodeae subsp. tuberculatae]